MPVVSYELQPCIYNWEMTTIVSPSSHNSPHPTLNLSSSICSSQHTCHEFCVTSEQVIQGETWESSVCSCCPLSHVWHSSDINALNMHISHTSMKLNVTHCWHPSDPHQSYMSWLSTPHQPHCGWAWLIISLFPFSNFAFKIVIQRNNWKLRNGLHNFRKVIPSKW